MWLTLIISGALHGLVLLPVILSLAGGPGFPMQEADEEWMSNALRNDYEYTCVPLHSCVLRSCSTTSVGLSLRTTILIIATEVVYSRPTARSNTV
jgi:hypothetical protein